MPYYLSLVFLLACAFVTAGVAMAQESLRLPRGLQPQTAKMDYTPRAKVKPLSGKIEHNALGGFIDTSQFQAGVGRLALPGRAESGRLQGGANQFSGQGQADSAPLKSGVASMGTRPPFPLDTRRTQLPGDLSEREVALLRSYDVVVLQDRSSSMGDKEYFPLPGGGARKMSRWRWCLQQASDLTRQTSGIRGGKVTLVMFSSKYDVYENVTLSQLPQIFARNKIFIGTQLVPPLEDQLERYFQRRDAGNARPLVIAIITDAIPQDDEDLKKLIINTTHRMRDPREITITFLQVGSEEDGRKLLRKLDNRLLRKGAQFDIVQTKTFPELLSAGLARSLVEAIQKGPQYQ
ncbi:MAG TPA: hypothetical protein V6D08_06770 [Candidatus Obscuribacterales bacterium]